MPKGVSNKRYTGDFKKEVVECMQKQHMSYREVAKKYDIPDHKSVTTWERVYLEEGSEGLYVQRQGRHNGSGGIALFCRACLIRFPIVL